MQIEPSHESGRMRRRVSSGMRKVVTFVAKRVTPSRPANGLSGVQSLLQTPAVFDPSSRFRRWLPVSLAMFMTLLTCLVLWSVVARLPTVFSDTKIIAQEIETLTERIHKETLSPDEQKANEEALRGVLSKEDEAQRKRARVNEELGTIETEKERLERREQELRDQQQAIELSLEGPRKKLRKVFDRDIVVHEGPPTTYDPGPQPKVRFYYPTRWLSEDWRAWRAAKEACDKANELQKATGIDLEEVAEKIAFVKQQVDAVQEKLTEAEAWIAKLDQERKRYTDAPGELLSDLDKLRKQLARTSFVRTVFWLLDIPTLLSCLATTAVAYSRMFLISGRFASRQLVRSYS
jgi:hypothetical protein